MEEASAVAFCDAGSSGGAQEGERSGGCKEGARGGPAAAARACLCGGLRVGSAPAIMTSLQER